MKKPLLYLLIILFATTSFAQVRKITPSDLKVLEKKEDSLKLYAKELVTDSLTNDRMRSDSFFTRVLIRSWLRILSTILLTPSRELALFMPPTVVSAS